MHVAALPKPAIRKLLFANVGQRQRQPPDDHYGNFAAGSTVGAGVVGTGSSSQRHAQHDYARDGGQARALFPLEQHLRQEGPQGHCWRVDVVVVLGKGAAFIVEGLLNCFFPQRVLEGQVTMLHERRQHQTKLPWQAFGMLVKWHETFPGQSKIRAQGRSHVTRIYARKVLVPRSAGVWPPGAATHATSLRRTDACCVERAPADRRWPLKMPGSAIRVWNFEALEIPAFIGLGEFQTPFFWQSPS